MSNYVSTENGRMNVDEGDQQVAEYFLRDLIYDVKKGVNQGGFEPRDVMGMMINWFRVAQKLRDPLYPRYYHLLFIRDAPPPPKGKKASQVLLNALQHLDGYPTFAAADIHAVYFAAAENAMVTFINEYRKVMATKDPATLKYFVGQIVAIAHLGKV